LLTLASKSKKLPHSFEIKILEQENLSKTSALISVVTIHLQPVISLNQNKMQKPVKIAIKVLYNRKWTKTLIFVSFFCLLFRANVSAFSPTPDQIISLRS